VQANNLSRAALKLCRAAGKSTYLRSLEAAIVAGTSARDQGSRRAEHGP